MAKVDPPRWTAERLEADRQTALTAFISSWGVEGTKRYEETIGDLATKVGALFDASDDLAALGDHKSDLPVRLHDGRLLAIECRVSNSAINSKKRLNNDVGAKAADWNKSFGSQVITATVLSGVYALGNLLTAQDHQGITIFWAHDLSPLQNFVSSAG